MSEQRFLEGLAARIELDPRRFEEAGTTVVGHESRAGSAAVACYEFRDHRLIWADPEVVDRVRDLAGSEPLGLDELTPRLERAGFELKGNGVMRLLDGPSPPRPSLATGYTHRTLDGDDPATIPMIETFTARCDPDDVDEAELGDLTDFDDAAINVALDPSGIVAYAAGAPWPWDPVFADIGVLVHGAHRRRGLAGFAVGACVDDLLTAGRIPLYRHATVNQGSGSTADRLGFRPVARIDLFVATA